MAFWFKIDFQDNVRCGHLGFPIGTIFYLQIPRCFLPSFVSFGLLVQEKKHKIDFQDGDHGGHLGFPIGTIEATFVPQDALYSRFRNRGFQNIASFGFPSDVATTRHLALVLVDRFTSQQPLLFTRANRRNESFPGKYIFLLLIFCYKIHPKRFFLVPPSVQKKKKKKKKKKKMGGLKIITMWP